MDILIPLVIIVVVLAWSVKRFKPEFWNKITAKFKK
jgi:regulatory protein YycH of two-component signal transduction system YycFG